jgi:ribosomal protein L34E
MNRCPRDKHEWKDRRNGVQDCSICHERFPCRKAFCGHVDCLLAHIEKGEAKCGKCKANLTGKMRHPSVEITAGGKTIQLAGRTINGDYAWLCDDCNEKMLTKGTEPVSIKLEGQEKEEADQNPNEENQNGAS